MSLSLVLFGVFVITAVVVIITNRPPIRRFLLTGIAAIGAVALIVVLAAI